MLMTSNKYWAISWENSDIWPKWSIDTENCSMENKSRNNNCSEDSFKVQRRSIWATLGVRPSSGACLASMAAPGPGDEANLPGEAPVQQSVTLSRCYLAWAKFMAILIKWNMFNFSFSTGISTLLLSTFPCPIALFLSILITRGKSNSPCVKCPQTQVYQDCNAFKWSLKSVLR